MTAQRAASAAGHTPVANKAATLSRKCSPSSTGQLGSSGSSARDDGLEPLPVERAAEAAPVFDEAAARPAYLGSLQGHEPEVVIGDDDRVRIEPADAFPWRAICSLLITAADDSSWIGTGWLAGTRTVVTAGHCLFIHNHGGWARAIEVIPGRNGDQRLWGATRATQFHSVDGWTRDRNPDFDYGAIVLPASAAPGERLGHFGFASYDDAALEGLLVNLAGYPSDKPAGSQWWHARRITAVTEHKLRYDIDTASGQSGAPVWRFMNGQRCAIGIHTDGHLTGNAATRINDEVFDNLQRWRASGEAVAPEHVA